MEAGRDSPWTSALLIERGFDVVVANALKVRAIAGSDHKNDRSDAELLARIARADRTLLYPIVHRGLDAQRDLTLIRQRDGFVRARTQLINQTRGFCKSLGVALPGCSAGAFAKRVWQEIRSEPYSSFETTLELIGDLTTSIGELDQQIERLCRETYPVTARLRQVNGVGPVTALCYVLTVEDPYRFPSSRAVGAYVGLCPRQRDSGEQQPQLGITKAGDALLRRLLVGCGHYIIGPFGQDSDLRQFGLRLSQHGGKAARKRAAVAVARKLAVLLHRLWISGADYEPLRNSSNA
jgi:transposase